MAQMNLNRQQVGVLEQLNAKFGALKKQEIKEETGKFKYMTAD